MSESLVGLSHLVSIFLLLDSCAGVVSGIHQLAGQSLIHGLLATQSCVVYDPADAQSHAAVRANLNRYLVVSTTYTACTNLQYRHNIFQCSLENLERIIAGLSTDDLECIIYNSLSNALLTRKHYLVDELSDDLGVVYRIR